MDDEDSKARRNFMAVSTIIVLAWWLQAPLDKISEKLLGMSSVGPGFEWRAWFAALVALVYFALRFRFSEGHAKDAAALGIEREKLMGRLVTRWLKLECSRFVKGGFAPVLRPLVSEFMQPRLGADGERGLPLHELTFKSMQIGQVDSWGQIFANKEGQFQGNVTVDLYQHRVGGTASTLTEKQFSFQLSRKQRWVLWAATRAWLGIYSRASLALLAPWLVGTTAAVVCVWRMWQAVRGA